jgi:hypothetical protein
LRQVKGRWQQAHVFGGGTGLRLIGGIAGTRVEDPARAQAPDFIVITMRSSTRSMARR